MQLEASTRSLETLMRLIAPGPLSGISTHTIDWHEIDLIARHCHVTVPLWMRLRNSRLVETMPTNAVIDLRRTFHENVRRSWLLKSQFISLARRLNGCRQIPIALKGSAYLLDPPMGNIARRYMHDLDIMAEDADTSQQRLLESGFETLEEKVAAGGHHLPALKNLSTGIEVEIHTRPFRTADDLMQQLFLAEMEATEVAGACFYIPSRATRIVTTVIHAQISDGSFGGGFFNPRYLLECAEYAVAWEKADWERAEAILQCNNLAYGNFRFLMKEFMGIEPPTKRAHRVMDTVQFRRIQRRKSIMYNNRGNKRILSNLCICKDLVRRRIGPWLGWQSIPRALLRNRRMLS